MGTRTSFYGFTAFSLTQSLMTLDGQGFRHVPLGKVSKEGRARPHAASERGRTSQEREPGVLGLGSGRCRVCSYEGREDGRWPDRAGKSKGAGRSQSQAAPGPEGGTRGPHTVLGPQDVRYLHFLEGTRDYEWLEAMFLNQSLVKTSLSWFRYPRPPLLPHPPAPRGAVSGAALKGAGRVGTASAVTWRWVGCQVP